MTLKHLISFTLVAASLMSCGRGEPDRVNVADLSSTDIPANLVPVCGDPNILGVELEDISNGSCGIDDPVKVYFVSGVELRRGATLNCKTAGAFKEWVDTAAQPSAEDVDSYIVRFRVASHYACRTRNSQAGARLSEHAKGNAIDIGGFTLANGDVVNVESDWRQGKYSEMLQEMYRNACGTFGTTLGPEADRHHQDHLHFDTADYRSGAYCR